MKILLNHSRSGLSLFEILTSMFILMVGLLGVLAVLPFGAYQMNRVNKADFGGNCGRAAIQEIQVRNWAGDFEESLHDPYRTSRQVYNPQTDGRQPGVIFNKSGNETFLRCDRPIIIDPLLVFTNNMSNDDGLKYFGFFPSFTNGLPRLVSLFPGMLDNASGNLIDHTNWQLWNQTAISSLKNQVFDATYWQDDRNFAAPEKPEVQIPRPVGVPRSSGGLQSHENYSWFYMLTPIVRGIRSGAFVSESEVLGYDVDVIVFFNRNLDLTTLGETERTLGANREGTGYRGGSFILNAPKDDPKALDLTDTRWLLLSCPTGDTPDNYTLFARWYRIVSYGEIEPHPSDTSLVIRRVMLLGPDVPNSSAPAGVQSYAVTLVQGAIHVYSAVIKK